MKDIKDFYARTLWKYQGKEYSIEDALNHLRKYGLKRRPGPGNPFVSENTKNQLFSVLRGWIQSTLNSNAPDWQKDLANFELKALNKWVGPQGAIPTADELMSVVQCYYDRCKHDDAIPEFPQPSEHVLSEWINGVKSYGVKKLTAHELFNHYKGLRKSNSGLTGWSDRRSVELRKSAISQAYKSNILDPIVVGSRDQRCKVPCRAIFMDSFANYFREVKAFHYFLDKWKDSDNVMWRGDRFVERSVDDFLRHVNNPLYFEADYEMMDTWMDKWKFHWTLQQMEKVFHFNPEQLEYSYLIADQLFTVPLFTPKGILEKEHSLLSGLFPTNPWETPFNLLVQLMWIEHLSNDLGYEAPMHLDYDFYIVINGDDSLIIFDLDKNPQLLNVDLAQDFADWIWNNFNILANSTKQRVSRTSGFFCKRQYKRQGVQYSPFKDDEDLRIPKSLYSLALALNGHFYPEDGYFDSKAQTLIKLFALFDNAWGHPLWNTVVKLLWKNSPELHISVDQADVDRFNEIHNTNWRFVLFGEKFSLENSFTAKVWFNLSQLEA